MSTLCTTKNKTLPVTVLCSLSEDSNKCPIVSGNSVYDAQALLLTLNPEIEFDWIDNCEDPSLRLEDQDNEDYVDKKLFNNASPLLYPNPTKDILSIYGISENCRVSIIDLTGRVLISTVISESSNNINTQNLSEGVYICELEYNNKISNIRFVIIK